MTEEIIIDGVNVAGCMFFEKHHFEDAYEDDCKVDIDNYCALCWNECKEPNCYFKQLKRLEETLRHTENGRKAKANKLKRIEEIVTHCIQGGFTDEFVQEIFDICREYEEV